MCVTQNFLSVVMFSVRSLKTRLLCERVPPYSRLANVGMQPATNKVVFALKCIS